MMLLQETRSWDGAQLLKEGGGTDDTGKRKDLFLKGIFLEGGIKNHNQRVYPVSEINRAVNHVQKLIESGETVWGEADHPEGLTINIERVSHMITNMWMDGSRGMGKLKIIDTPLGNIVRTMIECGGKLGVSSRGSGNVNESDGSVSEFEIVTVDIVARPSAPHAYPNAVYERKIVDILSSRRGHVVNDLTEAVRHDPKAQKHLQKEVLNWMDKIFKA